MEMIPEYATKDDASLQANPTMRGLVSAFATENSLAFGQLKMDRSLIWYPSRVG